MQEQKYFIKTYGCQMNVHDSERMAGMLESLGYAHTEDEEEANFILLNTCSVREKADQKLFTKLGRINKQKSQDNELIVAVAGCIAQRAAKEILQRAPFVDLILGPRAVPQLSRMISDLHDTGEKQICTDFPKEFDDNRAYVRRSTILGYVTIMEGCNKFCSYCIVPFTRGREISKPVDMVMNEVRELAGQDYKEIHLLGQNVNAYNDKASGTSFANLLEKVSDVNGIERIRFITSHPNHLTEDIMQIMAERENICNAIHLPPQSGSTKILSAMKRRYSREEYLSTVGKLKHYMRSIALSGDVIVGFPGETEDDFKETLSLVEECQFSSLFSFVYSPRPGTKAEFLTDNVSNEERLERLHRLQELQARIQLKKHQEMIGTEQRVLFDGKSQKHKEQLVGRTESNLVVNMVAPSGCIGRILPVTIANAGPHSLIAEFSASLTNMIN